MLQCLRMDLKNHRRRQYTVHTHINTLYTQSAAEKSKYYIHRRTPCLDKRANWFFCCVCKIELISIKSRMSCNKHLTKLYEKYPYRHYLGKFDVTDWAVSCYWSWFIFDGHRARLMLCYQLLEAVQWIMGAVIMTVSLALMVTSTVNVDLDLHWLMTVVLAKVPFVTWTTTTLS